MLKPVKALIRILAGNVKYKDILIPLYGDYPTSDSTPCITFDDSGGGSFKHKRLTTIFLPLPESHPLYDSNNPDELYPQEVLEQKYSININLNIWTNDSEERESITNQVKTIFNQLLYNHYKSCIFYEKENSICTNSNQECYAIKSTNSHGIKNQCPHPIEYGYRNILNYYNIPKRSFKVDPEYNLDDLNIEKVGYRTIIPLTMEYYTYDNIGGNPTQTLIIDDLNGE